MENNIFHIIFAGPKPQLDVLHSTAPRITVCCYLVSHNKGKHKLGMSENSVRIYNGEVTGGWRKLHNEELHELNCSRYIIRVIKSERIKWAGHVARMGRRGIIGCSSYFRL
jgi:hypothetical protein